MELLTRIRPRLFFSLTALALLGACGGETPPVIDQTTARPAPTPLPAIVEDSDPNAPILMEEKDPFSNSYVNPDSTGNEEVSPLKAIHFEYDRDRLTDEAQSRLRANANYLKENSTTYIRIEGHCDERGSIEYNQALGERRANAAREFLLSMGVDGDRMDSISFGEDRPVAFGNDEYTFALNRRAEFKIIAE